jgi:hypothetical protein
MRAAHALAVALYLVWVLTAHHPANAATATKPSADDSFFPIMAWNHAPPDPAVLTKMRECGLTVAGFVNPKHLDLVHAAGMKAIVSDARVGGYDWTNVDATTARNNVGSLVAEVGKHPAVFGYYLRDEPPVSYFAGLEKVASAVRELAPGKWPYINLFPNYADAPSQLQTKDYPEYLEKFIATCKPPILSYDHYALLDNGALGGNYWKNLEQMRAAAKKAGVPFWNIVLSVGHFNFREPTAADLRFEAYSTLAYGGRGLSYFTYFAPQVGNYRGAPIDQFGNPTPTWFIMQNVNLQVLQLAPTMLKLTSDDVYHVAAIPDGCHGPTDKSLLTAVNGDAMAGDFTHADGSRWVMIVNRDVNKSFPCVPTYRTPPKKVMKLSPYTGSLVNFEGEQIWVAPGAGVLLKLER